jgi:hypothetical protein
MPEQDNPLWELILMAAVTVTCRLMEPVIILHTERLLTVLMDLVEDLAEAEDGGKFYD